jgi:riboflavin kinase/FMN adenylyltransferase
VALGNFDGVHLGHQALLARLRARAAEVGGEAIAYTFEPHPVAFFFPDRPPFLLTTLEQTLELIASRGIRTVVVATFDADFASQTPDVFARDVLTRGLGVRAVVVGYNFTFGKDRAGTPQVLEALGRRYGFRVEILPPITVRGEPVSSSRIRKAVAAGLVEDAAAFLGRPYAIRGAVVPGHRRGGAQLGFPTANVQVENILVPGGGVYAAWVRILTAAGGQVGEAGLTGAPGARPIGEGDRRVPARRGGCGWVKPQAPRGGPGSPPLAQAAEHARPPSQTSPAPAAPEPSESGGGSTSFRPLLTTKEPPPLVTAAPHAKDREAAAVNVGTAPTFGDGPKTVEAHLLDFAGDLYGARLEVAFVARLRDERCFSDLAALKGQIAADVAAVRTRLA